MRLAGPETYGDCRRRGCSGGREREYVELPRSSHHPGAQTSASNRKIPRGEGGKSGAMTDHPAKTLPVEIAIFERQISLVQYMIYIYLWRSGRLTECGRRCNPIMI